MSAANCQLPTANCTSSEFASPMILHKMLLLFLGCLIATSNIAQNTISVATYLKNRVAELDNLPESTFQNKTFSPSWIDDLEFRTETNRYDIDRQQYTFRISPNTPKIRTAQANLYQLYLKKATLKTTLLKKDFIEIAFEEVLDFYEAFRKLTIKEALLLVIEDQEKVWRKLSLRSSDLPKEWLEIQATIAQLKIDIFKEEATLQMWQTEGIWLNWENLLPVDNLSQQIFAPNRPKFQLQAQAYDVNNLIVEREEELEQAEQRRLLDFFQVQYNGPHEDDFREKVSLTAAFRLPFSSNRQLKMEEIAIEKEVLQQERLAEKQLDTYQEKESRNRLNLLIQELRFTKEQAAEQTALLKEFSSRQSVQEGGNPLLLLYQQEASLKKELELLKLEIDIYQEYLDYLKLTEQLYQTDFYQLLTK